MKVLEVNNIDLPGRRFNGYDFLDLSNDNVDIEQCVIIKLSKNQKVRKILKNSSQEKIYNDFCDLESKLSINNVFSITSPALIDMREYKKCDIVHFHMFHNTKLSLYSLIEISKQKKVIITLHDPWFFTGRCVHFYGCNKWKNGCRNCKNLNTLFPFEYDNCSKLWELKKKVFDTINIDIVVTSDWMLNLVKNSPIFEKQKKIHLIPFGININKFTTISVSEAKKHYNILNDELVLFLRTQTEFKGTEYVLEALNKLEINKKVTIITCDQKGLLNDIANKYRIIDLGYIDDDEMKYALNACDIFLMPSKGESFGMMAVEAMSCSKPVIVFDNTALPYVTDAPNCGFLVKDRDSQDLMNAIKHLLENESERIRRGKLGRKLCEKRYDESTYNKNIMELYEKVAYSKNDNSHIQENMSDFKTKDNKIDILLKELETRHENIEYDKYRTINFNKFYVLKKIDLYCKNKYKQTKKQNKRNTIKKIYSKIKKILKIRRTNARIKMV